MSKIIEAADVAGIFECLVEYNRLFEEMNGKIEEFEVKL